MIERAAVLVGGGGRLGLVVEEPAEVDNGIEVLAILTKI